MPAAPPAPAEAHRRNPRRARRRRLVDPHLPRGWPPPEELARWRAVLVRNYGLHEGWDPRFLKLVRRDRAWIDGLDMTTATDLQVVESWIHQRNNIEWPAPRSFELLRSVGAEVGEALGPLALGAAWASWAERLRSTWAADAQWRARRAEPAEAAAPAAGAQS